MIKRAILIGAMVLLGLGVAACGSSGSSQSKSYQDGYDAALANCIPTHGGGTKVTNLQTQGCALIPDERSCDSRSSSCEVSVYCKNAVSINAIELPPSSDNISQWYAGCDAVIAKASF